MTESISCTSCPQHCVSILSCSSDSSNTQLASDSLLFPRPYWSWMESCLPYLYRKELRKYSHRHQGFCGVEIWEKTKNILLCEIIPLRIWWLEVGPDEHEERCRSELPSEPMKQKPRHVIDPAGAILVVWGSQPRPFDLVRTIFCYDSELRCLHVHIVRIPVRCWLRYHFAKRLEGWLAIFRRPHDSVSLGPRRIFVQGGNIAARKRFL